MQLIAQTLTVVHFYPCMIPSNLSVLLSGCRTGFLKHFYRLFDIVKIFPTAKLIHQDSLLKLHYF